MAEEKRKRPDLEGCRIETGEGGVRGLGGYSVYEEFVSLWTIIVTRQCPFSQQKRRVGGTVRAPEASRENIDGAGDK